MARLVETELKTRRCVLMAPSRPATASMAARPRRRLTPCIMSSTIENERAAKMNSARTRALVVGFDARCALAEAIARQDDLRARARDRRLTREAEEATKARIDWEAYTRAYHSHIKGEKAKRLKKFSFASKHVALKTKLTDLEGVKGTTQRLNSEHQHDVEHQLRAVSARTDKARSRGAIGWAQRSKGQVGIWAVGMDKGITSLALTEHGIKH